MKDAYYFSHDSNSRHDFKIQALRSVYGMRGYGMYWVIIEMMRDTEDYKLPLNQKIVHIALSRELECTPEEAKQFINDCIYEFGLFTADESHFWSDSLVRRMEIKNVKRDANRENGSKGGRPPKKQAEAAHTDVINEKPVNDTPKKKKRVTDENETVAQDKQENPTATILAEHLASKIKMNNANAKVPADISKWAKDIRLMMESDNYSEADISKMIDFSQSDQFWKANILSASKLREKAGTLVLQMNRGGTGAKSWRDIETTPAKDSGYEIDCTPTPERMEELRIKAREFERKQAEKLRMQQVP